MYKTPPECDVYDIERDARNYSGDLPVIAHPPCRAWGQLRHFAKPRPDEKELAVFAVSEVRRCGGVLEHPRRSTLWPHCGLPRPGKPRDVYGGFSIGVSQFVFGHNAEKLTLLYIVGSVPKNLPPIPLIMGEAPMVCGGCKTGRRKEIPKAEREHTPIAFAKWLVEVAESCHPHHASP